MKYNRSEYIKAGVREGVQNGTSKYANRRCYGYDVTADGSLVINPNEAKIVRWMFQRYLHGDSLGKIASSLEKQGILSPTGKSKWNREAIDTRFVMSWDIILEVLRNIWKNIKTMICYIQTKSWSAEVLVWLK